MSTDLSTPEVRVVPVGPRPLEQRAAKMGLGRLVRAITRGSTAALVIFGLATGPFASDTLGLLQSYHTQGASAERLPASPEMVHEVVLPSSPFVEAARWEDGNVDLRRMVNLWSLTGLSPNQMLDVAKRHAALGPTWLGTHDPMEELKFQLRAQQALTELRTEYPHSWNQLSDPQWVAQNANLPTTDAAAEVIRHLVNEVKFPDWVENRPRAPDDYDDTAQATARVAQAMKTSGLRSLQLSFVAGHTARGLMDTAVFLEQTNQKLIDFTGWSGPVMGLGGRIDVVIDPGDPNSHHAVTTTRLAIDRQAIQRPNVSIHGQPSSYFHELGHALDFVLAREAYMLNINAHSLSKAIGTLNEGMWSNLKLRRNSQVEQAMAQVLDGLPQQAPAWQSAREATAHRTGRGYWVDPTEGFGFALAAQFIPFDQEEPWRSPSPEESAQQRPLLVQFFKDIEHLNLTARPALDPKLAERLNQGTSAPKRAKINVNFEAPASAPSAPGPAPGL